MDKEVAISILEDIQNTLNKEDWKNETLKTIKNYEKKLKDSQKEKVKKLKKEKNI